MARENKEILNKLLTEWFNELNKIEISKHFWSENSTGKIIKRELKNLNHWKNRSGGRKGNKEQLNKARIKREENKKLKESKKILDW